MDFPNNPAFDFTAAMLSSKEEDYYKIYHYMILVMLSTVAAIIFCTISYILIGAYLLKPRRTFV
jgi:hypothetical protein